MQEGAQDASTVENEDTGGLGELKTPVEVAPHSTVL